MAPYTNAFKSDHFAKSVFTCKYGENALLAVTTAYVDKGSSIFTSDQTFAYKITTAGNNLKLKIHNLI